MRRSPMAGLLIAAALTAGLPAQVDLPGEGVQPGAHLPAVPPVHVQNPFQPFDQPKFVEAVRALGATKLQLETFAEDALEIGAARAAIVAGGVVTKQLTEQRELHPASTHVAEEAPAVATLSGDG